MKFPLGVVPFDDPARHEKNNLDKPTMALNESIYHKDRFSNYSTINYNDIKEGEVENDSSNSIASRRQIKDIYHVVGEGTLHNFNRHRIKSEVNDDQGRAYPDDRNVSSEDEDGTVS